MEPKELERLLLENLKIARENREYIIKIDRRQRWARNFTTIYWVILIGLAVFGTYYAFPYLQQFRETLGAAWGTVTEFTSFGEGVAQ